MNKKIETIIAVGGTGGHVIPGYNLAKHLNGKNFNINIVSDKRGCKFINKQNIFKVFILPSSPINTKNVLTFFISSIIILYSIFRSIFFLILNRPKIIFGMGGYASFPICIAASILKIKFLIYENNLIIGKANKYLLPFAEKILISHKEIEGINQKYEYKVVQIGNIIKNEIINFSKDYNQSDNQKISILILGGSQAAKIFANILPSVFKNCSDQGILLKIYQQCLPEQNEDLKQFYKKNNLDFSIFNFSENIVEYFSKVNLAITRSGSSMLAELTNANIPFISVPLPSSAENHQLKNAIFYERKKLCFLIHEKDLNKKLIYLIRELYENNSILDEIKKNQRQYSDKNVYNNIDQLLKDIIDEKN